MTDISTQAVHRLIRINILLHLICQHFLVFLPILLLPRGPEAPPFPRLRPPLPHTNLVLPIVLDDDDARGGPAAAACRPRRRDQVSGSLRIDTSPAEIPELAFRRRWLCGRGFAPGGGAGAGTHAEFAGEGEIFGILRWEQR